MYRRALSSSAGCGARPCSTKGEVLLRHKLAAAPREQRCIPSIPLRRWRRHGEQFGKNLRVQHQLIPLAQGADVALHIVGSALHEGLFLHPLADRGKIDGASFPKPENVVAAHSLNRVGIHAADGHGAERHLQPLVHFADLEPADPTAGAKALLDVRQRIGSDQRLKRCPFLNQLEDQTSLFFGSADNMLAEHFHIVLLLGKERPQVRVRKRIRRLHGLLLVELVHQRPALALGHGLGNSRIAVVPAPQGFGNEQLPRDDAVKQLLLALLIQLLDVAIAGLPQLLRCFLKLFY